MEYMSDKIEEKFKQLEEEFKKQVSYFNEIGNAIKKLRNDRKVTKDNISKIDGAMQAYAESVRLLKEDESMQAYAESARLLKESEHNQKEPS